ncbi:hypothetical protein NHX12_005188 [Muraenolepis orangiensis]|uniref:Uncharacterized protein n=1 Tax=Muraenolepis orangiensis TaxID=630683 RepID=A0A9Q0DTI4_9TELE|nr:hypothetical protein NHX12_005188 [Muraenolepis orangiensis]
MPSYFPVAHLLSREVAGCCAVGILQAMAVTAVYKRSHAFLDRSRHQKNVRPRLPADGWHACSALPGWLIAWHRVVPQMVRDGREGEREPVGGALACANATPPPPPSDR